MTQPFYSPGQGEPTRLQRRVAWQAADGVPAVSGWADGITNGGELSVSPAYLDPASILGAVERGRQIDGKVDVAAGPLAMGDFDPASLFQLRFLASAVGRYSTANVSGAHYRHRLGQVQATAVPGPLTVLSDDDLGMPERFADVRAGGFVLSCQNRQNLGLSVPVVAGKHDVHGEAAVVAGTGTTPILRHTWSGNREEDAEDWDIYIKATSATEFKVKVGSAQTYDGAAITAVGGRWVYLSGTTPDDADVPLGSRAEQLMLYVPVGFTWTLDDEWRFPKRRARWMPTFAVQQALAEVQARFFFGGEEIAIDGGWTLTVSRQTVETLYSPGSAQPTGTRVRGHQNVSLAVNRNLLDLTLQRPLLDRTRAAVVLEARNDNKIGATAAYYGATVVLPDCTLTGKQYSVPEGGAAPVEQYVFQGGIPAAPYSWNGLSYAGACEVTVDTNVTALI